jgi:hypothetical protein
MLDNNAYNLMQQVTEESQSLWRIYDCYLKDAEPCSECAEYWRKLAQQKEEIIQELEDLIAEHSAVCRMEEEGEEGEEEGEEEEEEEGEEEE